MAKATNRNLGIAVGAIIVLIVGVTFWKTRERPAATELPSASGDPTPARTVQSAQGEPPPRDVGAGRAQPDAGAGPDGKRSLLMGTPEDRERARREYENLGRDLERAHASQPVDAAWKSKTEASLADIAEGEGLQQSGIAPAGMRTDCRSSSCRVSAEFDKSSDAQDWATMFVTMTGDQFRTARFVTTQTPDGKTEIRIYGTRR